RSVDLPSKRCDEEQRGPGVDGEMTIETVCGRVQDAGQRDVSVAEHQPGQRSVIGGNPGSEECSCHRAGPIEREGSGGGTAWQQSPSISVESRSDSRGDAFFSSGSGDEN